MTGFLEGGLMFVAVTAGLGLLSLAARPRNLKGPTAVITALVMGFTVVTCVLAAVRLGL